MCAYVLGVRQKVLKAARKDAMSLAQQEIKQDEALKGKKAKVVKEQADLKMKAAEG